MKVRDIIKLLQDNYFDDEHINGHAFRTALATLCPNYSLGVDNDGQLIIYTNKVQGENDTYEEME